MMVANSASSTRFEAPTLSKMCTRWRLTVFSLIEQRSAIALLVSPGDDRAQDLQLARGQSEWIRSGRRPGSRARDSTRPGQPSRARCCRTARRPPRSCARRREHRGSTRPGRHPRRPARSAGWSAPAGRAPQSPAGCPVRSGPRSPFPGAGGPARGSRTRATAVGPSPVSPTMR